MYITRSGAGGGERGEAAQVAWACRLPLTSIAEFSLTEAFLICNKLHELNIVNIISRSYHKCSLSPNTVDEPRVEPDSQYSHRPMVRPGQKVRPLKRVVYFQVTARLTDPLPEGSYY